MSDVWYLSGPMSGVPQFNFPLFDRAAAELRAAGMTVVSPAEMDDGPVRDAAMASANGAHVDGGVAGSTWGDFLARDVKRIADGVTGIVLLPGWEQSRGARLEAFVGLLCRRKFMRYAYGSAYRADPRGVAYGCMQEWRGSDEREPKAHPRAERR